MKKETVTIPAQDIPVALLVASGVGRIVVKRQRPGQPPHVENAWLFGGRK